MGHLQTNQRLYRSPSIGPVLLHELTFCILRSSLSNALGSPARFQGHRPGSRRSMTASYAPRQQWFG
jgi:hypothetical protein